MNASLLARIALFGAMTFFASTSSAAIVLDGTRVVFSAPAKEASIVVRNQGSEDVMIQSWIEPDSNATQNNVPFAITPSLARLGGLKQQILRILYEGQGLPEDKESLVWLAVQEIPQKSKVENSLQIAIRQRIKLFYRPAGLPGEAADAAKNLQWKLVVQGGKPGLSVTNPSAFHVSFAGSGVTLRNGNSTYTAPAEMLAPGATRVVEIKGLSGSLPATSKVEFRTINDYGGIDQRTSELSN